MHKIFRGSGCIEGEVTRREDVGGEYVPHAQSVEASAYINVSTEGKYL